MFKYVSKKIMNIKRKENWKGLDGLNRLWEKINAAKVKRFKK